MVVAVDLGGVAAEAAPTGGSPPHGCGSELLDEPQFVLTGCSREPQALPSELPFWAEKRATCHYSLPHSPSSVNIPLKYTACLLSTLP
jgi:hypothetical protein